MAAVLDHLEQSVQLQAGQLEVICAERDRLDIALQVSASLLFWPPLLQTASCLCANCTSCRAVHQWANRKGASL